MKYIYIKQTMIIKNICYHILKCLNGSIWVLLEDKNKNFYSVWVNIFSIELKNLRLTVINYILSQKHLISFTIEIPHKDIFLKDSSWAESMMEELLQCPDQTTLTTQQNRKTAPLKADSHSLG